MEKSRKEYYKGSTFITVLLFLNLFSLLFFLMIEDYHLTKSFSQHTESFYEAKIMASMFLAEVRDNHTLKTDETIHYSAGNLNYQYSSGMIEITVNVSGINYMFYHKADNELDL
ncbi:hypothetical protein IW492_02520 [Enterococcus sp. BWB1-3]|uniref:competence type IV pilus minor pilin ComGG n=1 Tax=unclassified Enterococcus TaxID=2608891 RepID=UPI001920D45B|nr:MULTISPECIES: competence type IV pilus minor pilin ComGG [unclassified Enterococcus]MBL1228105.1 hypothetical protein [Enterococcus sp. BWB1-3]MCB5951930.1 hypothetical protein [Enterococcus sp. BWT-B8]